MRSCRRHAGCGRERPAAGNSGVDPAKRLSPEVGACFPDYRLYEHTLYALGFLTRGGNKKCAFCVVPEKEGRLKGLLKRIDLGAAGRRSGRIWSDAP